MEMNLTRRFILRQEGQERIGSLADMVVECVREAWPELFTAV